MELCTLVIYDIEDDRARLRVSEACKDFGLERLCSIVASEVNSRPTSAT